MDIYLEMGKKKTFAAALYWPGYSRWGRDEESALQALLEYGARYASAIESQGISFIIPSAVAEFDILERLTGTPTTDFGAPDIPPSIDDHPMDEHELLRQQNILGACWKAFDRAVEQAEGKELQVGPRGGGRDVEGMMRHVIEADIAYLARIHQRSRLNNEVDLASERERICELTVQALQSAVRDGLPESGPRGGKLWTPRYFVRRMAWHELDHAWELEDRVL
jgi:hypothetical protein